MWRAIFKCAVDAAVNWSTVIGLIAAAAAALSGLDGKILSVPSWVFWTAALALLFVTACRAYWALENERNYKRKPEPTIRLKDVMSRIRGKSDHFGPDYKESQAVSDALLVLQEKAALGLISVFGRLDWRNDSPSKSDNALRLPIPPDEFRRNYFGPMFFFENPSGGLFEPQERVPKYVDIWFDRAEIDKLWPEPWRLPWRLTLTKAT